VPVNDDRERMAVHTIARLARLIERADTDLSLPQYRVLAMVGAGDERATRLANRLNLAKPTITAMVESLVERGLIRREEVAGDRRAVSLQITPAGEAALASAEAAMIQRVEPVLERLDVADREIVLGALESLQRSLDAGVTANLRQ
jgi:DNA-binding MarR family transcriptional regulator